MPLAEATRIPGRCWKAWEIGLIHGVDTAGPGLLRVGYGDSDDPRLRLPGAVSRP